METLKNRLKRHEGLSLFPYKDSEGFITLGYGRCLDKRGISQKEADAMLQVDIDAATNAYRFKIPEAVQRHCNTARVEVLICMIFQMGLGGVLKFKRMLSYLAQGDFNKAADEMCDSLWATQTPARCTELSEMMRRGT